MNIPAIGRFVKELATDLAFNAGGHVAHSVKNARGTRVLVYHGVVNDHPFRLNHRFISASRFEKHLQLFTKHFNLVTLEQFRTGNLAANKLNLLLTFDDGYRNNYETALPLLSMYNAPAVFFVCKPDKHPWLFNDVLDAFSELGPAKTRLAGISFQKTARKRHWRYIDEQGVLMAQRLQPLDKQKRNNVVNEIFQIVPERDFRPFGQYLDLMTTEQLVTLTGMDSYTIAAHTNSHLDLTTLAPAELEKEFSVSSEWLRELQGNSTSLAFPYGAWNNEVAWMARKGGFDLLFGTENAIASTEKVNKRLTINPFVSAVNEMRYIARDSHE